jgi:hypothetical protein
MIQREIRRPKASSMRLKYLVFLIADVGSVFVAVVIRYKPLLLS